MNRHYNELVAGRIFIGSADDTEQAVSSEQIDTVFDVRVNGREGEQAYNYIHAPITEEATAETIKAGAVKLAQAYEAGEKIYIHCGSGTGRAGVMAVATLLEIGATSDLDEAISQVKGARPAVKVRENMQVALETLYKK
ncbi:dual specificity protein phosphatase family protein [Solibacillus cecembensis]|uniref:protein-tyrosine phosphatase family protein n=1 Tax=Solibacillus cecembensis TaxID=459347 RepID=UPI00071731D1